MANYAILTIIGVLVLLFAQGVIFYFYTRANDNKRRIDELERAQHEQRLPTTVSNEVMDITAISARATRQLREAGQTISDLRLFIDAMADESERITEKARQIRSNGQRKGK